jgi:hypothetical protein
MDKRKVCITVSYCTTLMRSKDNELGQYATGCAPRDPVYGKLLQEVQRKAKTERTERSEPRRASEGREPGGVQGTPPQKKEGRA